MQSPPATAWDHDAIAMQADVAESDLLTCCRAVHCLASAAKVSGQGRDTWWRNLLIKPILSPNVKFYFVALEMQTKTGSHK